VRSQSTTGPSRASLLADWTPELAAVAPTPPDGADPALPSHPNLTFVASTRGLSLSPDAYAVPRRTGGAGRPSSPTARAPVDYGVGRSLLEAAGWRSGEGLGAARDGRASPVAAIHRNRGAAARRGLGAPPAVEGPLSSGAGAGATGAAVSPGGIGGDGKKDLTAAVKASEARSLSWSRRRRRPCTFGLDRRAPGSPHDPLAAT